MRKTLLTYFIFLPFFTVAQNGLYKMIASEEVDSLSDVWRITKNDTLRMAISRDLCNYYAEINDDSALLYSGAMLKIAQTNNFKLWEAAAHYNLAYTYRSQENYPRALEGYVAGQKIASDANAEKNIPYIEYFAQNRDPHFARYVVLGNILDDWAGLYHVVGDTARYFEFENKAIMVSESINDKTTLSLIYMHLANKNTGTYPDSAYQLYRRSLQYALEGKFFMYRSLTYNGMGWHWLNKKNYDSTEYYFRNSLLNNLEQNTLNLLAGSYGSLSIMHLRQKQFDSSLYYARNSLAIANITKNGGSRASAYIRLSNIFFAMSKPDSSLHYLRAFTQVRDSLLNIRNENLAKYQTDAMNEQVKVQELEKAQVERRNKRRIYSLGIGLLLMLGVGLLLHRNNRQKQKANKLLKKTLADLSATQSQLIQSEKMASLGELTAGIAHEIQNPLNFVNNFSEVSNELIEELKIEKAKPKTERDDQLEDELLNDISQNLEKINHHGKRADAIVKGMLQHSRSSSGQKEPTDINALADEYLKLAYHGLRAKDKSFNATLKTDYDEAIAKINIIPQDIGRVILNLITNAFYAVAEKKKEGSPGYEPTVSVSTMLSLSAGEGRGEAVIKVADNGNGIPQKILDKIFQPFFTTKPTGQGTGLGLSLAYDIVKAHGGELKVETKENEGSTFIIQIPAS